MRGQLIARGTSVAGEPATRVVQVVKEAGMGDSQAIVDGESPLGSWPASASRQPDRTRVDLPARSAFDAGAAGDDPAARHEALKP